jgi:hypothetical protein
VCVCIPNYNTRPPPDTPQPPPPPNRQQSRTLAVQDTRPTTKQEQQPVFLVSNLFPSGRSSPARLGAWGKNGYRCMGWDGMGIWWQKGGRGFRREGNGVLGVFPLSIWAQWMDGWRRTGLKTECSSGRSAGEAFTWGVFFCFTFLLSGFFFGFNFLLFYSIFLCLTRCIRPACSGTGVT